MKKYLLADTEAGWYRFCDTLTEAAKETDNHEAEKDAKVLGVQIIKKGHTFTVVDTDMED